MAVRGLERVASQEAKRAASRGIGLSSFYDLALRNLRARLTRTLLTLLGIVMGVAVILAIDITNATTFASIRNLFDETAGRANIVIEPKTSGRGLDPALATDVRRVSGVILVAPSVRVRSYLPSQLGKVIGNLSLGGGDGVARGGTTVLGVDPDLDPQVRIYQVKTGRLLAEGDGRKAVVGAALAEKYDITLGKDVELLAPDGFVSFEVVGVIESEGVGRVNDGRVVIAPLDEVQDVFARGRDVDELGIVAAPEIVNDPDRLDVLKAAISERVGRDVEVQYPAARGKLISQMLASYQVGLGFFSAVAIFVGAFLIYNTFSMTVLERTREIGVLRALGTTRWQIIGLILVEAVLLAAVGSSMGILVGITMARGLITAMSGLLATRLETVTVPLDGVLIAVLVGAGVTLASAFVPALSAGRISPLEAIRVRGRQSQPGLVSRYAWLIGLELIGVALLAIYVIPFRKEVALSIGMASVFVLLLGATLLIPSAVAIFDPLIRPLMQAFYGGEGLLGSSNVQRSRGRTALTVAALMVGVAMVIGLGQLSNSFRADILAWVNTAIGGDLYVRAAVPMREELAARIAAAEGVAAVTPVTYMQARLTEPTDENGDPQDLVFTAVDPATYLRIANFKFASEQGDPTARVAELAEGDALFVSTVLAEKYNLKRGDVVSLETARGVRPFRVAAVIVDFSGQGFAVTGSRRDLARYFGESKANTFLLQLTPGADREAVRQELSERFGKRYNVQIESSDEFRQRVLRLMNQSFALLNVLVAIAMIVAALGVINTLLMNILERIREIGMLRSLGMTRRQVSKMVLAEAGTMGLIGGAFGLVCGMVLARVFVLGTNMSAGYSIEYAFTPEPVIGGVIIAIVVAQLAALYPAWRAGRVNIVEAIQHE
ncbi:MAG: ABC transporter permease [Ardenticatenaceae bacterium]|nr:ABC transporter permease [Ardenticatenaceae bacterium]